MPTALITGANRGIGLELTRQYLEGGWKLIACCRQPDDADELRALQSDRLDIQALDVTDHLQIEALVRRLKGLPVDVLINNAGIIGPVSVAEHIAQQHFGSINYELWERVIRTNTFAPVKMAEALLPNLLQGKQKKIVTLSSTVGSITERDTAAFAYATSKTAVNKAMTLVASQLRELGVTVVLVCPGYVKTRMDFGGADVEVSQSASGLRKLIEQFTLQDSGSFTRFNGEPIAW